MSFRPLSIPCLLIGGDEMAMAYRAFDHWLKHEHAGCEHEDFLECVEVYAEWARHGETAHA